MNGVGVDDDRPVLWCFAAYPVSDRWLSGAALVPLELAAELKSRGWWVIGPDPEDEQRLAAYERDRPWVQRFPED